MVPNDKCIDLIYKILCNDCEAVYIGEAKQLLSKKLKHHTRHVRKQKRSTASAIHDFENGHGFDANNATIIAFESHLRERLVRESIEIRKNTTINYTRIHTDRERVKHDESECY